MKPLLLEPCIHCRAVAVLPRMRKDCRVLTKRLRRWPDEGTRRSHPVTLRQSDKAPCGCLLSPKPMPRVPV